MIDASQIESLRERLETIERLLDKNIYAYATDALDFAMNKPRIAANNAGIAIEGLLGLVYTKIAEEKGEKIQKNLAIEELKAQIGKIGGEIPRTIVKQIDLVQQYRNEGSHFRTLGMDAGELSSVLNALLQVLIWYLKDIQKETLDFSNVGLKTKEKQYIDFVSMALADGVISNSEREFLNTKIRELGLPPERAKQIEEKLYQKLGKPVSPEPVVQTPPAREEDNTLNRREARVLEDSLEIIYLENKPLEALKELEFLQEKYPRNKEVSEAYAMALREKENELALKYLASIKKKSLLEHRLYVEVLAVSGDFNSAFDELEEMGKQFPNETDVLQVLEAHLNILEWRTNQRAKLLQTAEKLNQANTATKGYFGYVNALVKLASGVMKEESVPQELELYYRERLTDEKAKREREEKLAREKAEKERQEREAREAKERAERERQEAEEKNRAEKERQEREARDAKERAEREERERKERAERERKDAEARRKQKEEEEARERETPRTYTNSLGMEFILIPAGEFMMGAVPQDGVACDSEKPQHRVRITKPFYMGKYPVTQGEWEKLMGSNPSRFKQDGNRAPMERVSWDDCQEFINKLNKKEGKIYRLPTEAEWEYAARGGGSAGSPTGYFVYTYGDDAGKLGEYAWYRDNSNNTTHPVGQKKPNSIELYDMTGNVREWCEDWYDDDYYKNSPQENPKGPKEGMLRSLRGGSWNSDAGSSNSIAGDGDSRLSYRSCYMPDRKYNSIGFRLVLLP